MAGNATAGCEPLSNRFTLRLYTVSGAHVGRSRAEAGVLGEEVLLARRAPVVLAGCIHDNEWS